MTKKLIIILIITNISCLFAQINSGSVTYKILFSFGDVKNDIYRNQAVLNSEKLEYTLTFNQNCSLFSETDKLTEDKSSLRLASAFTGYINPVYYSNIDKSFTYNNSFSPLVDYFEFRIKFIDTIGWKISDEVKFINNYKCFKATSQRVRYKKDRAYTFPVTAWFCPEIPLPFGPMDCAGLPGLIFELEYENASFVLDKMELNKNVKVEEVKKGHIVTVKEFNDIFNTRLNEATKYLKNK
ncbi:GLPGLI family protein [Flavobacterium sp. j3]|uniref:GLPGLI family protein n=1 Tax=Flavobacterium aureirubrum TaxID=3133147 RepID=A0ABU9N3G8_9FLAO